MINNGFYLNAMFLCFFSTLIIIVGIVLLCCFRQFSSRIIAAIVILLGLAGWGWFGYAAAQPWEIEAEEYYDIKMVVFPDGSKQQMYTIDGQHNNVTQRFGKIAPDNWRVKRIRFKWLYCGVSFWVNNIADKFVSYELVPGEAK